MSGRRGSDETGSHEETDPLERKAGDETDLHGIATWEPKTPIDAVLSVASRTGLKVAVAALTVVLLVHEFERVPAGDLFTPVFAGFVLFSIVPALAIVAYIWYTDVVAGTYPRTILLLFFLGGAIVGIAILLIQTLGGYLLVDFLPSYGVGETVAVALLFLLIVAPVEEVCKLFVVWLYAYDTPAFESVISGALYGAIAGLGFATVENAIRMAEVVAETGTLTLGDGGVTATVRALAGPGHVIYSAIAGFYLGLARFNREHAGPLVLKGLVIAIGLHALYNMLVDPAVVDILGWMVETLGLFDSETAALFTFAIVYNGLIFIFLLHKLSLYKNTYLEASDSTHESIESELTEFDP